MRGGEKVLEALCELYPDAELYTLVHVPRLGVAAHRARAGSHRRSSSGCPAAGAALPAATCRSSRPPSSCFDLDGFDLVISSSHCAAKSVVRPGRRVARLLLPLADALRLGPVRRLFRAASRSGRLGSRLLRPVMAGLARWDRATAGRVDRYRRELSLCCGPDPPIL